MIYRYLFEVNNNPTKCTEDDLQYRADRFVEDIERLLSARRDFKED